MRYVRFSLIALFISRFVCVSALDDMQVNEHGFWSGEGAINEHAFDEMLAHGLVNFFKKEKAESVADFGCGTGEYVHQLLENGIFSQGFDGNPDTVKLSRGVATVADLSQPINLNRKFDWVMSLEVGEHIPNEFEKTFIENLHKHNVSGIVLSWAFKGQMGVGHVNEQNNDYIKSLLASYGYENDIEAERVLRSNVKLFWFRHTLMVFRKR